MKTLISLTAALTLFVSHATATEFSQAELSRIGRKVWQNECAGSVAGLTSWNEGENFASLGIGHFIWYPKTSNRPFDESFPALVHFLAARGARPPAFVTETKACPWASRGEFLRDAQSERIKTLRAFLAETVPAQTAFLVQRMEQAQGKMLAAADAGKREKVRAGFARLQGSPRGAFALIDYVNFKGEGTLATERYQGEGWGLLQVLETMDSANPNAVRAFADAAKTVLTRRVQNAPSARGESRWLPGWKNRCESYASE